MAGYDLLYLLGFLLLLYALALPFAEKKLGAKKVSKAHVRRVYYSIWVLGTAYIMNNIDKTKIHSLGSNKLGFNEEMFFFLVLFFMGFLVDILIISALELRELTLPGGASLKGSAEVTEQLTEQANLTDTLTIKIEAYYKSSVQLFGTSVIPIKEKLDKGEEVIFAIEFQKLLQKYISLQEDWDLDVEVIEEKDMPGKEYYGLTGEDLTLIDKHMTAGKAFLFQKREIRHMIVPFDSLILGCPVYVVLTSKNDIARVEYVLVLMLLQQFEAHILG